MADKAFIPESFDDSQSDSGSHFQSVLTPTTDMSQSFDVCDLRLIPHHNLKGNILTRRNGVL